MIPTREDGDVIVAAGNSPERRWLICAMISILHSAMLRFG